MGETWQGRVPGTPAPHTPAHTARWPWTDPRGTWGAKAFQPSRRHSQQELENRVQAGGPAPTDASVGFLEA